MDFFDRFEVLELLREDVVREERVQTFRARERATGRAFEAHFASSPDLLSGVQAVIDQGGHEGKFYVVTAALDSAGAWRIKPPVQPLAQTPPVEAPGDFTRMFQLRQAPEPVAVPVSKPMPATAAASSPGAFTRAFEKPAAGPSMAPVAAPVPGEIGEFTRMFQQPAPAPSPARAAPVQQETSRPSSRLLIVVVVAVLSAIAVFIFVRRLY